MVRRNLSFVLIFFLLCVSSIFSYAIETKLEKRDLKYINNPSRFKVNDYPHSKITTLYFDSNKRILHVIYDCDVDHDFNCQFDINLHYDAKCSYGKYQIKSFKVYDREGDNVSLIIDQPVAERNPNGGKRNVRMEFTNGCVIWASFINKDYGNYLRAI